MGSTSPFGWGFLNSEDNIQNKTLTQSYMFLKHNSKDQITFDWAAVHNKSYGNKRLYTKFIYQKRNIIYHVKSVWAYS